MSETRAEIDAKRAIAEKAYVEALMGHRNDFSDGALRRYRREAEEWAREEFPYPKVTRPRVVTAGCCCFRINESGIVQYRRLDIESCWRQWENSQSFIMTLASLLPADELRRIAAGPCGPTEEVDGE